jgi:hypothetical protein
VDAGGGRFGCFREHRDFVDGLGINGMGINGMGINGMGINGMGIH